MQNLQRLCGLVVTVAGLALVGCNSGGGSAGAAQGVSVQGGFQGQAGGLADVDGDGIADLVVCAPGAKSGSNVGAALVYKGGLQGFSTKPSLVLTGGDNFGQAYVDLGDVDGDGIPDFAISSLHGSGPEVSLSGSVTVFKGGGNGQTIVKLTGEAALDRFGYCLAAGDLNGDGTRELIIGAPFQSPSPALYQQGAVYVYDFKTRTLAKIPATPAIQGLGWTVAAGNLNGDSFDDLVLSAKSAYGVGNQVLVYSGKTDFLANAGSPDVSISSTATGFGASLAVLGDENGDGFQELAIGAPQAGVSGGTETGSVFIVKGGTGKRTISVESMPNELLTRINGEAAYDRFGTTIASVGDMDLDGKPDFVVGATHADSDSLKTTGKVYLLKGKDLTAPETSLNLATQFKGTERDMHYGSFLAPFLKNGHKLLIGAPTVNRCVGGVYAVDLVLGLPVFNAGEGGTPTIGDNCCGIVLKRRS